MRMNPFDRILSLVIPGARELAPGYGELHALRKLEREMEDTILNATVKRAIHQDPELQAAGIHVATSRNVVQLSGFVESRRVIGRALEKARGVRGVAAVRNDMRLK
jgi:osmotically-inducible protein OsmY